jgi:hypothetical protein
LLIARRDVDAHPARHLARRVGIAVVAGDRKQPPERDATITGQHRDADTGARAGVGVARDR